MRRLVCAMGFWAACGGGAAERTSSTTAVTAEASTGDPAAYAAVAEVFTKKRPQVAQCLANAISNREEPENTSGRVKLALRVLPSGKAENVRVAETTFKAASVGECMAATVAKWSLPAPADAFDFVYVYEMTNK
jgi:hypothetical protein